MEDSPKSSMLRMNLWPRLLFSWKIVICVAAPPMKRARKTAVTGMSTDFLGAPPSCHICGAYGPPPVGGCDAIVESYELCAQMQMRLGEVEERER